MKIVVHTGTAVFHEIGGFKKVSGPDVILAHRLLKNSVTEKEYLLMSEAGYSIMGHHMEGPFVPGTESYDGFGNINTFVRYNTDIREKQLNSLYTLSPVSLTARAELYSAAAIAGAFPALIRQIRKPAFASSRMSWLRFALLFALRTPMMVLMYVIGAPRRLFARRAQRNQLLQGKTEST